MPMLFLVVPSYGTQFHVSAYDLLGVPIGRIRDLQRQDAELSDLITFLETDELPSNNNRARSLVLIETDFIWMTMGCYFPGGYPPNLHTVMYAHNS